MKNHAVTSGKLIAFCSLSLADVSAVNPLVIYDIHGRKKEVLFFSSISDITREFNNYVKMKINHSLWTEIQRSKGIGGC
jgi:hypothetical protein